MTGTASDIAGAKVKELRTGRGWSVRRLVDECKAVGFDVTSSVIENIEGTKRTNSQPDRRRRALSVDELIAFAYVFDVSPLVLLLGGDPDDLYPVTPTKLEPVEEVYLWIVSEQDRPDIDSPLTESDRQRKAWLSFIQELPWAQEARERNPAWRSLQSANAMEAMFFLSEQAPDRLAKLSTGAKDALRVLAAFRARASQPDSPEGSEQPPTGGESDDG